MKFLIFFALAFAAVKPKDLYSRLTEDTVLENEGRITNGHKADPAKFKYMVGIDVTEDPETFWCGGSLIGKKWVLSSAHCTNEALSVTVYLGSTERECGEKSYEVPQKDLFTHPLWNPTIAKNDISLIQIPETNESSRIKFVKIPKNDNDKYLGKSVVVSGWGQTSDNATELPDDLQYGILKVSPGNICSEHFGPAFSDDLRICVDTPDRVSTCHGDSGGPMVLEGKNLQIGVNSYASTHSCTNKEPVVFTRISAYRLWIFVRTGIKS